MWGAWVPKSGVAAPANVKGSILQVNGVLYVTAPDYVGQSMRGTAGNSGGTCGRRVAARISPTAARRSGTATCFSKRPTTTWCRSTRRTGKERWNVEIADFDEQYFSTTAPIVVDNHVLVGTGNDLDMPGFLQSFDPETGALQWKLYTVPMKDGDPGPEHVAEPRGGKTRRRPGMAARRLRSRPPVSTSSAREIRHRHTPVWRGQATTCLLVR